ncbi:MAG: hypothetical protein GY944_08595 [bacterium]|nr:hypothetical protein [bacterium]
MTTQAVDVGDSSQAAIRIFEEVTWGTDPGASVTYQDLPFVSETLRADQPSVTSEIVNSTRRINGVVFTDLNALGDITTELILVAYDAFWAALAMGTMSAGSTVTSATTITVAASGTQTTYTRGAGDFTADGWIVGDWIYSDDFANAANNVPRKITTATALVLTAEGTVPVAEALSVDLKEGKVVTDGNTFTSYAITKDWTQYSDTYLQYLGMALNAGQVSLQANNRISLTFSFIGKSENRETTEPGDGSPTAASTNNMVEPAGGPLLFLEGGAGGPQRLIDCAVNWSNGLYPIGQADTIGPIAIGKGPKSCTGSWSSYVTASGAEVLMDKYHDKTRSAVAFVWQDDALNYLVFDLAKVVYTNMTMQLQGGGQASQVRAEFTCEEATEGALSFLWRTVAITAA